LKENVVPPQALDAEESVLGSILIDPEAIIKVSDLLAPGDFYSGSNGKIYEAMLTLSTRHQPIDMITISANLAENELLEQVGGNARIAELTTRVPSASNILEYAQIVKKKATLRKMILAGDKISGFGFQENEVIEGLLEKAEKEVFSISQVFLKDKFVPIREILSERFDKFAEAHMSEESDLASGVKLGFRKLDSLLSGFQPSDLAILAARPSMGKTAFALSIALNAALKEQKTVGIFSLEMSKEQLVDRMFASRLAVDSWKLQKGKLEDADFQRMGIVMDELSSAPIYIDDSIDSSIPELRAKTRRLQMEHGLDFVIIDYLQLMSTGNNSFAGNRVQEISEISRSIKALARELHVPILALSQLSRAVEMRTPKIPQLADLRESGAIEQDADVVLMMYREDYYEEDTDREGVTDIFIRKHRNGPIGHVELMFDKSRMRFFDIDTTHEYA
jgi:replicative DNA helicase